jgi:hypothetical protein
MTSDRSEFGYGVTPNRDKEQELRRQLETSFIKVPKTVEGGEDKELWRQLRASYTNMQSKLKNFEQSAECADDSPSDIDSVGQNKVSEGSQTTKKEIEQAKENKQIDAPKNVSSVVQDKAPVLTEKSDEANNNARDDFNHRIILLPEAYKERRETWE